jgi:hypothetical protein
MNVRLERIEKYVTWLNKEIANWAEFQTGEILNTECNMQRYKVPFKKITELEESLKGYITFNESKQYKAKKKDRLQDFQEVQKVQENQDIQSF